MARTLESPHRFITCSAGVASIDLQGDKGFGIGLTGYAGRETRCLCELAFRRKLDFALFGTSPTTAVRIEYCQFTIAQCFGNDGLYDRIFLS